jgi:prevent-host-death family protein
MPTVIPITSAKPRLAELIKKSDSEDVLITQRGHAAAVLVSATRYTDLLDRVEYLEDSLDAILSPDDPDAEPAEKVFAELGLD